ncbi:hypothetical protein KIW84_072607 [Lathyrus oleraceus]|uniref:Uncharacterized protein n=1 Tax=Pisum sativum TaxID=3888 RepID=A0A9D4VM84_PEA|nr:hypothetical protein KIW84_072607 [Pisum sativum]
MPRYAKFMKDILTKKRRHVEDETILLDARCSAIIQKTLPRKESDPGRVVLPVTIGGTTLIKSTRMTLQLADKSTTSPYGVAQDMLVKVDKFLFPVDFVIVEMDENRDVPLILGRPFMKTARMMIDIDDGLMKVRVQDEEVTFNIFEAMKHSNDKHDSFRIDATEEEIVEVTNQVHVSNPLERSFIGAYNVLTKNEEKEIEVILHELESCGEIAYHEEANEDLDVKKKVGNPKLELKMPPSHLKYVFLGDDCTKPVIISNTLSKREEHQLIQVLEKKEVVKLLEAEMICPISDSEWVQVLGTLEGTWNFPGSQGSHRERAIASRTGKFQSHVLCF